jgi:hypothetical protein
MSDIGLRLHTQIRSNGHSQNGKESGA